MSRAPLSRAVVSRSARAPVPGLPLVALRMLIPRRVLILGALLLLPRALQANALPPAEVVIRLEEPTPGETVRGRVHLTRVAGSAQSGQGEPLDFDVLLVLDVSQSTRYPSGIDVDGDDEIGLNPHEELELQGQYPDEVVCTDPDDAILAAQVKAARTFLEVVKPGRTRVGLVTFSGESDPETGARLRPDQEDAHLQVPLTDDFGALNRALDGVLERGPGGATNYAAAIQLSVVELAGLGGARSEPRANAKKVVLFLTDGTPTFPFGRADRSDPEDIEAARSAARVARVAGLAINTYVLGRDALFNPLAPTEVARITGGQFTPVRNPGDIVAFLQGVSFANVDDVVVTNLTTRDVSYDVSLSPDGTFEGFVPVAEGANTIQVTALASDGGETSVEVAFDFEKSGLSEREMALELERIKKRNRELMLLIERERIQKFRDRQRKRVEITVGEPDAAPE